jgi:hypothetical protein
MKMRKGGLLMGVFSGIIGLFSCTQDAQALSCSCSLKGKSGSVKIESSAYGSCSAMNGTKYDVSGLGGPSGELKDCK